MRYIKSALGGAAAMTVALAFYGCNGSDDNSSNSGTTAPPANQPSTPATPAAEVTGKWTTGDLHVHTIESDDAQGKLVDVLDQALVKNNLDWTAISNHLRPSTRDQNGTNIVGGPLPFSQAMAQYEIPAVRQLQVNGSYTSKLIFSAFEWDMPTHDHMNVAFSRARRWPPRLRRPTSSSTTSPADPTPSSILSTLPTGMPPVRAPPARMRTP